METTAQGKRASRRTFVSLPDRPDIRQARVFVIGAWSDHYQSRGIEIAAVISYVTGESERRTYDFVPGHDKYADKGGWDTSDPRVTRWIDNAAKWLHDELVPPCSMEAS